MEWAEAYTPIIENFLKAPIKSVVEICQEGINKAVQEERLRILRIIQKEWRTWQDNKERIEKTHPQYKDNNNNLWNTLIPAMLDKIEKGL